MTKSVVAVDRILAELAENSYDVNTPDTVGNRKGFEHHFGFAPDTRVTQVYYYEDELGADCRYQLAFKCEKTVVDQIISALGLVEAPSNDSDRGLPPLTDFAWWQADSTRGRTLWVKKKQDDYYWELWYSEEDGMAFYQEYSI